MLHVAKASDTSGLQGRLTRGHILANQTSCTEQCKMNRRAVKPQL